MWTSEDDHKRVVIVGGGAGGLELACRLGRRLRRTQQIEIVLIDRNRQHVWKPLLHEVATGAFNSELGGADYLNLARINGFSFAQGELQALDVGARRLTLGPSRDRRGRPLSQQRQMRYHVLVLAVGSESADFGIPGVAQHAFFLDGPEDAEVFHEHLLSAMQGRTLEATSQPLDVAIVGAGATGVELAAELESAARYFRHYWATRLRLRITLVEAGERILPALNPRIAAKAQRELLHLGVTVRTGATVTCARKDGLVLAGDERIPADLMVWAAGIRGPALLGRLGLATTSRGQLAVDAQLRTSDPHVFALGDCCDAAPPRAQAASQQAEYLTKLLTARCTDKPFDATFAYRDYGSLVSLAEHSAVGGLMSSLSKRTWFIEGHLAHWTYVSLHRRHQMTIYGARRMFGLYVADLLNGLVRPRLKLH
ncbi:MAG: NAD(P)/FAD-dependent oxidoreductase [Pseudomonadales bacterium]